MYVHAPLLSCVGLCDPVNYSHAPLSLEFSRQEHWSGWSFLNPGDFTNPGIKSTSPAFLTSSGGLFTHLGRYGINTAAAAAAKLLQSCLTLCDPIDGSPPGTPVPGIRQARTLEWVASSFSNA